MDKKEPSLTEEQKNPPECPECKSPRVLPIVYGYPAAEDFEAANEGKITLGGCVVEAENPTWLCAECGHKWGIWRPGE